MQELSELEIQRVSGGGVVKDTVVGSVVSTLFSKAMDALSSFASNGQAPNYSNTTPMGDMY
jgi:hypothetical protein